MVLETFTLVPVAGSASYLVYLGPVVVLIAAIATLISSKSKTRFIALLVVAVLVFSGTYAFIHFRAETPVSIVVGNGYMQVSSSQTGTVNVTSNQISSAYVGSIGTGNMSIRKEHGLNNGVDYIGVFSIDHGKTADVITDNFTSDLIVQLNTGNFVIVGIGGTNFTTMVSLFSQEVYPV